MAQVSQALQAQGVGDAQGVEQAIVELIDARVAQARAELLASLQPRMVALGAGAAPLDMDAGNVIYRINATRQTVLTFTSATLAGGEGVPFVPRALDVHIVGTHPVLVPQVEEWAGTVPETVEHEGRRVAQLRGVGTLHVWLRGFAGRRVVCGVWGAHARVE